MGRQSLILIGAVLALPFVASAQAPNPKAESEVKAGIQLKVKGDLAGAEGHYREAIRLDPGYAEAHYNLGILLTERGDIDGAIFEYRRDRKSVV